MKILAPISSVEETEMLLECGADELYCGLSTSDWQDRFGNRCWMNRRHPDQANLDNYDAIVEITKMAHANDVPVFITLNAPFYPPGSLKHIICLCERLCGDAQVDGFIVCDLPLLSLLAEQRLPAEIHLSSLGSCFNSEAVRFYGSMGVKRIILPRQLHLSEIEAIVANSGSDMEFEVFGLNDGCFFEEGFCQTSHSFGPFCMTPWDLEVLEGPDWTSEEKEQRLKMLKSYMWYQNNCGSSFQADGLPNGPCSLCWLGHFRDWGIAAVKIVGREASFFRKMRSLQLVKTVMDTVRSGQGRREIADYARSLRDTAEYCAQGHMCYYWSQPG